MLNTLQASHFLLKGLWKGKNNNKTSKDWRKRFFYGQTVALQTIMCNYMQFADYVIKMSIFVFLLWVTIKSFFATVVKFFCCFYFFGVLLIFSSLFSADLFSIGRLFCLLTRIILRNLRKTFQFFTFFALSFRKEEKKGLCRKILNDIPECISDDGMHQ